MKNRNDQEVEIDLLRLFRALWRRVWVIAVVMILCGALALSFTMLFITPQYEASIKFYIYNKDMENQGGSISATDLNAIEKLANTYTQILQTRTALETIIEAAGVDYTHSELSSMLSAGALNETTVYQIRVKSPNPKEAVDIANAIAEVMPSHVTGIMSGGIMSVLDDAVVPSEPVSPSIPKNMIIGMLLGFVVVCGIIIVLELVDDKIHDTDYLTQNYELPVLAVIPDLMQAHNSGSGYSNSYATSRVNAEKQTKK